MVDVTRIGQYVETLRDYQDRLYSLKPQALEEFLADPVSTDLARQRLQICIQTCIDIARHVVASKGVIVRDAQEVVQSLNQLKVIPDDFLPTLRKMVGMRNALVHLYMDVDNAKVYEVIQNHLDDFDRFVQYILEYIERQDQGLEDEQ